MNKNLDIIIFAYATIEITMMLRKITLLQSVSMWWAIIRLTAQNLPLVRGCSANVWPTTILIKLLKLCWTNVGLMQACQQWRVAHNTYHYPTLAQRFVAMLEVILFQNLLMCKLMPLHSQPELKCEGHGKKCLILLISINFFIF